MEHRIETNIEPNGIIIFTRFYKVCLSLLAKKWKSSLPLVTSNLRLPIHIRYTGWS